MSTFKSKVAPKGLDFSNSGHIVVSDKYMCILTAVSYPRSIGVGYLSNITNMPGVKLVIFLYLFQCYLKCLIKN